MKKKLPLIIVLLFAFWIGQAQTNVYHPFPESNASWCDTTCGSCTYTIIGDTIVNSNTYHKLHQGCVYYQTGTGYSCNYSPGTTHWVYVGYAGAIRQDTVQRKVFILLPDSTSETLLYNFSLTVGDTIKAYVMNGYIVTSIDSILIGIQYRKTWEVAPNWNSAKIIEGIGGTLGLLNTYYPSWGPVPKLYCFSYNNQTLYPYFSSNSVCAEVTGISNHTQTSILQIYPNPAQNNFTIETSSAEKQTLSIFDVNGKQVFLQNIQGTTTIDASNLSQGVYNINITSNTGMANKRLVIVK